MPSLCPLFLPSSSPRLQHHPAMALPGAPEKELSKSWILFKRFYRQVSSEINAGTGHERGAQGTEEAPRSCLEKQGKAHGEPGQPLPPLKLTLGYGTRYRFPQKPALPPWLVSVFSNTYEGKEKVLKIYHPLRLLFPVKLSGFSLSFLFGMKRSGLFWQPEGATKTNFLRTAWVPPIKAFCCRPGSQRSLSGCLQPIKGTPFSAV